MSTGRGFLVKLLGVVIAVFVLIQLVPYGRSHTNPPVVREPNWDSPHTKALFLQTCGNCHSNETKWPWYSNVAPASWLVQHDVDEGRAHFNASDWKPETDSSRHAWRMLDIGRMPPSYYLPLHPEARLSVEDKAELVQGLMITFASDRDRKEEPGDHDG
jgi:hypothetical protein